MNNMESDKYEEIFRLASFESAKLAKAGFYCEKSENGNFVLKCAWCDIKLSVDELRRGRRRRMSLHHEKCIFLQETRENVPIAEPGVEEERLAKRRLNLVVEEDAQLRRRIEEQIRNPLYADVDRREVHNAGTNTLEQNLASNIEACSPKMIAGGDNQAFVAFVSASLPAKYL